MQGFQYQDFVVQNKDGKDAGDIDAAFVLTQDTSLNEMLSGLCSFPPESLKAGTFIQLQKVVKALLHNRNKKQYVITFRRC